MLIKVEDRFQDAIMQYRNDSLKDGQKIVCGSSDLQNYTSYQDWKAWVDCHEQEATLPQGRVCALQYLYVDEDQLIGMVNIRLYLNEYLKQYGGHVGYSIAPTQRGKGYGKKMLQEACRKCKELGIHDILLVAEKKNMASIRTILACKGRFENEVIEGNQTLRRYFIHVS